LTKLPPGEIVIPKGTDSKVRYALIGFAPNFS
jgi:hypothetical protein